MQNIIFLLIVLSIGLTHGLEPGHGWPIALIYSVEKEAKYRKAFISSSLISIAHFISSIFSVIVYIVISEFFVFETFILTIIAFILLLIMALISLGAYVRKSEELHIDHSHDTKIEKEHKHSHFHKEIGVHTHFHRHFTNKPITLKGIVIFAFILGFAHQEEFALLSLAMIGVNPYLLMIFYAIGVFSALIGITLLSLKFYEKIKRKVNDIEKYLPLINFISFLTLAFLILFEIFIEF